jgi:hypothetical protein
MILNDDDRPIRLRPRKPLVARREGAAWVEGYRLLMHYARSSRKFIRNAGAQRAAGAKSPYGQRCAVRVTYLNNRTRGQWRAHGRYLARDSATEGKAGEAGFSRDLDGVNITRELERWQSAGDPRVWKVILSPEFGDRIDLKRLARDLVGQMANDLRTDLEWLAVAHYNTEHPHVHMTTMLECRLLFPPRRRACRQYRERNRMTITPERPLACFTPQRVWGQRSARGSERPAGRPTRPLRQERNRNASRHQAFPA